MKQFFKTMFASMFGFILAQIIFIIIGVIIMAAFIGSIVGSAGDETKNKISENSILKIELNTPINDRSSNNPFEGFDFGTFESNKPLGLNTILRALEHAKLDKKIKGIYLNLESVPAGMATMEEIREALVDFKTSGKFIVAYSEVYTQKAYYLASVADKMYMNPAGDMELKGLSTSLMFFKNTLEKLEVEPEIIRHGKFKSAVEPFMYDKMSAENRKQTMSFVGTIWNNMLTGIGQSRKISIEELNSIATNLSITNAEDAVKLKLIDKLSYYDEIETELKNRVGLVAGADLNFVSLKKYSQHVEQNKQFAKDKIAVIYASGEIQSGDSDDGAMGSETIAEAIKDARLDSKIKAIVLRVNSPGGSALASDVMWREVILAKKVKPVIVSMGDVAASGGYYISCAADKIFADKNTITGSIGVFGLMFNAKAMLNNKLGLTFDTVMTNKHADMGSIYRPLTNEERNFMQMSVERVYKDFITKVGEGRKMDIAQVDSVGQGRVWSGVDAKNIGLIDEFGGLNAAIMEAAKMAKLSKYKITELPKQKEPFEKLMEDFQTEAQANFLKTNFGVASDYITKLEQFINAKGIQARMPFELEIY
ncbi:MAG: signal peptide peptidase SppA [Bacteroidota bacterium]